MKNEALKMEQEEREYTKTEPVKPEPVKAEFSKSNEPDNALPIHPSPSGVHERTIWLVKMAMMLAISVLLSFVHFPVLPGVPFIEYELSDVPIVITAFAYGTPAGLIVAAMSIILHDLLMGSSSGAWYGMIVHFVAIGTYLIISSLIYRVGRKKKTRKRAVIGLVAAILGMTAIMIPTNLIATPIFLGMPVQAVVDLILPALLPVNLIKGTITAVLTFLIYKRVSPFLHKW